MKLEKLITLRNEKHLSQDDIAKYLNISKIQYYRYEYGAKVIPLECLIKLANFYDTSTDYILELTDTREKYHQNKKITN